MIKSYRDESPRLGEGVFIEDSAQVIGRVEVGAQASIWFNAVVRGDVNTIHIGARTNVQDGTVVHVTKHHPTWVGDEVTIGHNVTLHGCRVEAGCLIGMGAVVLDDVVIGAGSIVAAGAVVTPGSRIPPGSLVMGAPAKVRRSLKPEEQVALRQSAQNYIHYARDYMTS